MSPKVDTGFVLCGQKTNAQTAMMAETIDIRMPSAHEALQSAFLTQLTDKLDGLTEKIAESILGYYNSRREELGYSNTDSKEYPEVDHAREILKTVTLIGITIPDQDDYDDTAVSFVFDCTWDKENGVGVCLIGDEIDEVGPQDIAL